MPRVTILSRGKLLQFPDPSRPVTVVAVTYQSELLPPRTVQLPDDLYRDATLEEGPSGSSIDVVPVDDAAQKAEDDAIRQDLAALKDFAPPVREL